MYNFDGRKVVFMALAIVILILSAAAIFLIKTLPGKVSGFIILAAAVGITLFICVEQPVMHKPFSINIIEYLVKFNEDGSITTTKQTTTTVLEGQPQK